MYSNNAYTYASPFDRDERGDRKTTFLLRTVKTQLEKTLGYDLSDELFCNIMEVTYGDNASDASPYDSAYGAQQSYIRLLEDCGYEKSYAQRQSKVLGEFFFYTTGILKQKHNTHRYPSIVLHIPHAGTKFFDNDAIHQDALLNNARDVVDWHTDLLFAPDSKHKKITPVVFPYCRTVCDVERMTNDPMEALNLGICYDSNPLAPTHGFFSINSKQLPRTEAKTLSLQHYTEHHHKVERLLLQNSGALLIDCHSFSSHRTVLNSPTLSNEQIADVDICIGYNDDATYPSKHTVGTTVNHFASLGYRVAVNTPFSNAKTFNSLVNYHSVMIEINKKLYMDEHTIERNHHFCTLHKQIVALYDKLLDSTPQL